MVIGTPRARTIAAACGSTKKLNSAAGVTLPRSRAPPISTIRATLRASSGAWAKARAGLVKGPSRQSVTDASAAAASVSSRKATAWRGSAKHRNVGPPRQLEKAQRVGRGEIDRDVAGHGGDAEEVETLGLGEGEQDGDGVVLAGIGVDD